ncbi:MAG: hypothetical protein MJK12_14490 [Colwellia sp.]|nr:hypothetical protein [Colwellia sp.]
MSISEEILIIANKIANEGKKPTIARVKTKLTSNVPLPILISTLRVWQHEPTFTSIKATTLAEVELGEKDGEPTEISEIIKNALAPIKQELVQLRREIDLLKSSKP